MRFSFKDFVCKCDKVHSFLRIWSHLMRKFLIENIIFCVVYFQMCLYSSSSVHNFSYLTKSWQILAFRPPYWFTLKEKRPISSNRALKADSRLGWPNNFLMFWSYFLLKKENYPISAFVQSLFSTKKSPKVVNLPLTGETLTQNSLAKSCTLFWKYSETINRNNIFELTYYK